MVVISVFPLRPEAIASTPGTPVTSLPQTHRALGGPQRSCSVEGANLTGCDRSGPPGVPRPAAPWTPSSSPSPLLCAPGVHVVADARSRD